MDDAKHAAVWTALLPLWKDLEKLADAKKPLLAHYTTVSSIEKILSSKSFLFSHPLLMNDLEELRYGIDLAVDQVNLFDPHMKKSNKDVIVGNFRRLFIEQANLFFNNAHAFNTFILCFSEHEQDDRDGVLSMWRAYGENGDGAAIVFDTSKIEPIENSPLILSEVVYGTADERRNFVVDTLDVLYKIVDKNNFDDADISTVAIIAFERLKLFALFSKHKAFAEEREWRAVVMPNRDYANKLPQFHTYMIGSTGIEPKFRFPITPVEEVSNFDIGNSAIVSRIILGPTSKSPFAVAATKRMMNLIGMPHLADKVVLSTIPYRKF